MDELKRVKFGTPSPGSPPPPTREEFEFVQMNEGDFAVTFSPNSPNCDDAMDGGNDNYTDNEKATKPHPMNNPVILKNLFSLCPTKLLSQFRLVSKLWHDISLVYWRNQICLSFDDSVTHNRNRNRNDNCTTQSRIPFWTTETYPFRNPYITQLHKFLSFIENPKNDHSSKPYRRHKLSEWEFRKNDDLIENFWEVCGCYITTLEINQCTFCGVESFRNVIYNSCPYLKNLSVKDYKVRVATSTLPVEGTLYKPPVFGEKIHLTHLTIDMDHDSLPVSWLELLSHFPSLVSIKLYNADVDDAVMLMLNAIKIIKKRDRKKLAIKHLDILSASLYAQESVPNQLCVLLQELHLPLESVTIDFGVETEARIIKALLFTHSSTLNELNVYRGPTSVPYKSFPFGIHLNKMTTLITSDRLCENLEFIKFMPNLKKLQIYDAVQEVPPRIQSKIVYNTWEAELTNFQLHYLTQLRVDYLLSVDDLRNLVGWMPNIEQLRMTLNDKQFAIVCEYWTKITHLEINGVELTDEGITGRRLRYTNEDKEGTILKALRPNITHLKFLRYFMMMIGTVLPTKLMDESAFHGFLKTESLQILKLNSQMGDAAKDALREKIPECNIVQLRYNTSKRFWEVIADEVE